MKSRLLTGIKPTGTPHLGNYLGAMEHILRVKDAEIRVFIADYHALTTLHDPKQIRRHTREIAASWLALGLDPSTSMLFRQSAVPQVHELAWLLSCVTGQGVLDRSHAVKAARDAGQNIPAATVQYPVLMAADILIHNTDIVPVGVDQIQHLELTRDMARSFNHTFGGGFTEPKPMLLWTVPLPGLDGRKMSKSYGNVLPIFSDSKELKNSVAKIKTDSKGLADVKDPDTCSVFQIYSAFASPEQTAELRERYLSPGMGYGHAKQALVTLLQDRFEPYRMKYEQLLKENSDLDDILNEGGRRANCSTEQMMCEIRSRLF